MDLQIMIWQLIARCTQWKQNRYLFDEFFDLIRLRKEASLIFFLLKTPEHQKHLAYFFNHTKTSLIIINL